MWRREDEGADSVENGKMKERIVWRGTDEGADSVEKGR